MGAPRALALCQNFGGALDFQIGRWSLAEEQLRRAVDLYRQVGSASGESLSLQRLGVLLTALGQLDEASELLSQGLVTAERAAMRAHCLTRLHASMLRNRLSANDEDGVRASLAEGLEAARRHGHCVTCNALLLPEAVRAEIVLGELDAADAHASELEKTADEFQSRAWTAMACHARARVLHAQGKHDEALAVAVKAREAYTQIEQSYDAARCLVLEAACFRARGGRGAVKGARELEQKARDVFETLRAPGIER
jgi:ATP/maltotriose-dependent transcriptional regulator MalT